MLVGVGHVEIQTSGLTSNAAQSSNFPTNWNAAQEWEETFLTKD